MITGDDGVQCQNGFLRIDDTVMRVTAIRCAAISGDAPEIVEITMDGGCVYAFQYDNDDESRIVFENVWDILRIT